MQQELSQWLDGKGLKHQASLAGAFLGDGGRLSKALGQRYKRMGSKAGFPDLTIFGARGRIMFLELKTANGILSDAQREWQAELRDLGFEAEVAWSLAQAKEVVEAYFFLAHAPPQPPPAATPASNHSFRRGAIQNLLSANLLSADSSDEDDPLTLTPCKRKGDSIDRPVVLE